MCRADFGGRSHFFGKSVLLPRHSCKVVAVCGEALVWICAGAMRVIGCELRRIRRMTQDIGLAASRGGILFKYRRT